MKNKLRAYNNASKQKGEYITMGNSTQQSNTSEIPEGVKLLIESVEFDAEEEIIAYTHFLRGIQFFKGDSIVSPRYYVTYEGHKYPIWPTETIDGLVSRDLNIISLFRKKAS